jgi:hypothetical protein
MSRHQQAKAADAAEAQAAAAQQQAPPAAAPPPPPPAAAPVEAPAEAEDDTLAQLERLGQLKASGVLTEEEFAAQKAKILGG